MNEYPHLVSLALIVALSTLAAGLWAESRRRNLAPAGETLLLEFVLVTLFMLLYSIMAFLIPALIVTVVLRTVFSAPSGSHIVIAETTVRVATLFSIGANFADVASTFGRVSFLQHAKQYCVAVLPTYIVTMGVAWLLAQGIIKVCRFEPLNAARAARLFAAPVLAHDPVANIVVCILLVLGTGAVSFLLRRRGGLR